MNFDTPQRLVSGLQLQQETPGAVFPDNRKTVMNISIRKIIMIFTLVIIISLLSVTVIFAKENDRAENPGINQLNPYQGNPRIWKIVQDWTLQRKTGEPSTSVLKLKYIFGQFFLGVDAHYQKTKYLKDWSYNNYSNWGIGGQIGLFF